MGAVVKVSTVGEMRAMDQAAIERFGIPETVLMENAGQAAFSVLARMIEVRGARVVLVCGGGNNGGDGLVVARHVVSAGGEALVFLLSDPDRYGEAARLNFDMARALKIDVTHVANVEEVTAGLDGADVVVDALLGTGIARPVEGLYAGVIGAINRCRAPVLSIDIPSGVNGDTGQVMGTAVQADSTVTFGLPKTGNMLLPGWELGGELFVSHISFPPALYDADDLRMKINVPVALPARNVDGHKGTFGQALFVAGAAGYYGAPYLSAMSYYRSGGGYARLAAPLSVVPTLATQGCEIVFVPQDETPSGSIAMSNLDALAELAGRMDFVVIGPGLSLVQETQEVVHRLVSGVDRPMLIDGDGLTAVRQDLDCVRSRTAPTVLTPHLGEMSRLTGLDIDEIEGNRVAVLRGLAGDLGATVVMKGAHTLVGQADGRIYVNLSGNSGMATAGSGDVLTGAIAGMYGLGLPFEEAVRMGVFVHGLAGDLAAEEMGKDGMAASDVLAHLPAAVRMVREEMKSPAIARYFGPEVV